MNALTHILRGTTLAFAAYLTSSLALAQPPSQPQQLDSFLAQQIQRLGAPGFRTRELALERLLKHPAESLRLADQVIDGVDHNVGAHLVDLIGTLAMNSDININSTARRLLKRVSRQPSYAGSLATKTLLAIADLQEVQAIERLVLAGAQIHNNIVRLHSLPRALNAVNPRVLELGSQFKNSPETVAWIPYLKSFEQVVLDEIELTTDLMTAIATLDKVHAIKMRHVTLQMKDLHLLRSLDALEYLEIAYTDIDDSSIDALASLPVSQHIRLFGTRITDKGAERLKEQLDTVEIFCGGGGFLGVGTPSGTTVTRILPNSSAAKAGIRLGDQLKRINSVEIQVFDDLRRELGKSRVGDKIKIELLRTGFDGKTITVIADVTLGEEAKDN